MRVARLAWTIARRDYLAAVASRLFLLFLALPLILAALGVAFGAIGARTAVGDGPMPRQDRVAVIGGDGAALIAARDRLAAAIGGDPLPLVEAGAGTPPVLIARGAAAVLTGGLASPRLWLAAWAPADLPATVTLLLDQARAARALGAAAPPPVRLTTIRVPSAARPAATGEGRVALARGVQYGLLVLTMMLAGRLLSSFIEERSNKVIEVLAAAVPIDAIFLGKLAAMLLFSLTCVLAWGTMLLGGAWAFAPALLRGLATPAVGWPAFALLALVYFAMTYLLLGAILLGLGAQASSPADVQTLALPTTMAQLLLFGFASLGVGAPDGGMARAAALLPWSSALAMAARAAEVPTLWPHGAAILWQGVWLALTVRMASGRFRRAVLKSGPARRRGG